MSISKIRTIVSAAVAFVFAYTISAESVNAQSFPAINSLEVRGGFAYLDDGPRATSWAADLDLGTFGDSKFSPVIGASYWHTNRLGRLKATGGHLGLRYSPFADSRFSPYLQAKAIGQDMNAKSPDPVRDEEWSGFEVGAGLGAGLALGLDRNSNVSIAIQGERVFIKEFSHWGVRAGFAIATGSAQAAKSVVAAPPAVDPEELRLAEKAAADARQELNTALAAKSSAEDAAAKSAREAADALRELGRLMRDVVTVSETSRGVVITLGDGLFAVNQDDLSPRAADEAARIAAVLKHFSNNRIQVEGHTDSTGPERYNQGLSERRAKSVADALSSHGIASSRMELSGHAYSAPIADNDTKEGRAKNRRVEIVIVGAKLPGS